MRNSKNILAALVIFGFSHVSLAETVDMPQDQNQEYAVQLPGRGMTMETVRNRFGEPVSIEPAVGEPPITRWMYNTFTVYFESEYVIHSVVNNQ